MNPLAVTMVDYGAGNLSSVIKGFEAAGALVQIAAGPDDVRRAQAIVVPGVGHFDATRALDDGWREAIGEAIAHSIPLLGICLGMHWLFEGSDEAPDLQGLAIFEGRCTKIPDSVKVPHVGWNTIERTPGTSRLLESVDTGDYAYFAHSYAAPVGDGVIATVTYGDRFAAAVEHRRVYGVQFHPEKSGRTGVSLLRNFVAIAQGAH